MFAGGKQTLQSRDGRRLSSHTFCNLCLRETRFMSCLQKLVKEFAFFTFDPLDFPLYAKPAEQLRNNLIMSSHL